MSKIKIDGIDYVLFTDELSRYDGYYFNGMVYKYAPIDTRVVGYIKEDGLCFAICKAIHRKWYPYIYAGFGLATLAVSILCFIAFNPNVEVPHWVQGKLDNVVGNLDSGQIKISDKFKYNQYATYDGKSINVAVNCKGSQIAIKVGDVSSDFYPSSTTRIPMQLSMEPQDILQAQLLVQKSGEVLEYPLVIERFSTIVTDKPKGNENDFKAGQDIMNGVIDSMQPAEPTQPLDKDTEWNTYVDTDYNFEDFQVIVDNIADDWSIDTESGD